MIEDLELTIRDVGLDHLSEFALMRIFASVVGHRLTAGTGNVPTEVTDKKGNHLYAGYYYTHLEIPPTRLLSSFTLWQQLSAGAELESFQNMVLAARAALGAKGEVPDDPSRWPALPLPRLSGGLMFWVDNDADDRQVTTPLPELVGEFPPLARQPQTLDTFREVRKTGSIDRTFGSQFAAAQPIEYPVLAGRDVPVGPGKHHALQFATFIQMFEHAERTLLTRGVWPRFPVALADSRTLLERETYYFANCPADDVALIDIRGRVDPCAANLHGPQPRLVSCGVLSFVAEIFSAQSGALLAATRATQLLAIPTAHQGLIRDAERQIATLAG